MLKCCFQNLYFNPQLLICYSSGSGWRGLLDLHRGIITVPSLDNTTRWNTKYTMLVSVANLRNFVEDVFNKSDVVKKVDLNWDSIDEMIRVLEPVKEATVKLQKEQLLLGGFLIIWMTCKEKLEKSVSPLAAKILAERSRQVNYRSGQRRGTELLPSLFDHSVILAAIFMDPRVFTYLTGEQREAAKGHLASLYQRIEAVRRRSYLDDTTNSDSSENEGSPTANSDSSGDEEEPSFLKTLQEKDKDTVTACESQVSILIKLEQYYRGTKLLKSKSNVLEFWDDRKKSHPEIYALS